MRGRLLRAHCDCAPQPALPAPPDINYLAKDYDGFRQVMLDRLAVLVPDWTETHAADLGIALIEVLAYAADHLSYQQDAVGTEAYLGTARSRISLRRHARLVDYRIGEGTQRPGPRRPRDRTGRADRPGRDPVLSRRPWPAPPPAPLAARLAGTGPAFAALQPATVFTEQNEITFYTWGDGDCCLPAGATAATLTGHLTSLAAGTVLVVEEVLGPATGSPADADPAHRCAVVLTVGPAGRLPGPGR